jgi:hypothetical protein
LLSWLHVAGKTMGELIDVGSPGLASAAFVPMLIALVAVVLYGIFSADTKNDDDDSSPGGGLMQPVS